MKQAADILETTRLDKELSFQDLSRKTRIPIHYLEAFEKDNQAAFPAEPYCSLMVREYAGALNLNPEKILSLFRRDHEHKNPPTSATHHGPAITPQITYTIFIILSFLLFSGYLLFEYVKFNRPPHLKVNWPEAKSKIIEVSGQTDPESTIKINNDLVVVDLEGSFKKQLELSTPEAKIIVESRSPAGKTTVTEKIYK
ncbi:MAG: helix-turn-helix domain-containing protein [Patescibacteria group bacterium]